MSPSKIHEEPFCGIEIDELTIGFGPKYFEC